MESTLVLFNRHTLDGVAAAVAARTALRSRAVYREIDYPTICLLGSTIPEKLDRLYILGLDFSIDQLRQLALYASTVIVIGLNRFDDFEYSGTKFQCKTIEDRSCCVSTWGLFHPARIIPTVFEYIEDVIKSKSIIQNSLYAYYGIASVVVGLSDEDIFNHAQLFLDPAQLPNIVTDGFHYFNFKNIFGSLLGQDMATYTLTLDNNTFSVGVVNCPRKLNASFYNCANKQEHDIYVLFDITRPACSPKPIRTWSVLTNYGTAVAASRIADRFGGFGNDRIAGFITTEDITFSDIMERLNG
jgi:hypothetical protein